MIQIIKNVSHAIYKYLGLELIKLPESKTEVDELISNFFEYHGFPQCISAIDGTHIEIKEPEIHSQIFKNQFNNSRRINNNFSTHWQDN